MLATPALRGALHEAETFIRDARSAEPSVAGNALFIGSTNILDRGIFEAKWQRVHQVPESCLGRKLGKAQKPKKLRKTKAKAQHFEDFRELLSGHWLADEDEWLL